MNTPLIKQSTKRWVLKLDTNNTFDMSHWTELARSEVNKTFAKTSDSMSISRSVSWGIPLPFNTDRLFLVGYIPYWGT